MKISIAIIISIYVSLSCGGSSSQNENALIALLPSESGDDGLCTVAGLGSQIRAGFTEPGTEEEPVKFNILNGTGYAVIRVKGANTGTVLEISQNTNPDIYLSDSCPLQLGQVSPAVAGTDMTIESGAPTKITFLKRGSYMAYFQIRDRDEDNVITTKVSGTPQSSPGGGSRVGDLEFNKSCSDDTLKTCTNLYGTETDCGDSGTEGAELCGTDNVFGVCRIPKTDGYRFTLLYTDGWSSTTLATTACSGLGGSFSSGYSEP